MTRAIIIALLVLVNACRVVPGTPAPHATPSGKGGTIRINFSVTTNVTDVPMAIAEEILTAQGYTIEHVTFNKIELVPAAMEKGDLDLANGSYQLMWAALAKGAPAKTILQRNGNQYVIAASRDLKSCADLQGKPIAMGTSKGILPAMLTEYFAKQCPGVTPETLVIGGSNNRIPALMTGAVPAAQLELDDMARLEEQAPGRFHALIKFGQEFPDYGINGHYVSDRFAREHPEAVRDFIRATLEAHRRIQDPAVLRAAIIKYVKLDEATASRVANQYLAQKMWDVNGGLTQQSVENLLAFLIRAQALPAGTTVEQVADLSYLNAVLGEIGRKSP